MGRKPVIRQDLACPSCGSHHVVKCGKPLGRGFCVGIVVSTSLQTQFIIITQGS
ncbi:hypothetical protein J5U22_00384 [Saccharolobus shibatae]|uniref:Uncharacterized protein n=1 Tax=Saccharolobus shibatae TaxID=2286 RepID=A0A8F5GY52_9CREN|nr:hypothetical protein J5U22_00384 [Saccharolobus shibatae]